MVWRLNKVIDKIAILLKENIKVRNMVSIIFMDT